MSSLMKSHITRRVEKIHLDSFNAFMPLFEAISNSIQAIEDKKLISDESYKGKIKITLSREKHDNNALPLEMNPEDYKTLNIKCITIFDNGIGFTDENFESFLTYDSPFKKARGGKGEGRLFWLKQYDDVIVTSKFQKDNSWFSREFKFSLEENGVDDKNHKVQSVSCNESETYIKLCNLKNKFYDSYNISLENYARKIISHFICYFLNSEICPQIVIEDGFESLNVNSFFKDLLIDENILKTNFIVNENVFNLCYLKIKSTAKNYHQMHICADNRSVKLVTLKDYISNLSSSLKNNNLSYFYQIMLSSEYLDNSINCDRSSFYIDNNRLLLNTDTIIDAAIQKIKQDLSVDLEKVEQEKIKKIRNHIKRNSPQYRILMSEKYKDSLQEISPTATGTKLELELYDQYYKINRVAKQNSQELLSKNLENIDELSEFKENFKKYVEQINDVGKSKLADYVAYRKAIIELLSKLQKKNNTGKYPLEKAIHEIIFPMNSTSDDIDYEKHNLWTIDERLAYHYYLASDKKLNKIEILNSESSDRPDILIYNNPFFFTDNEKITTATIIEFKRPERDDYTDEENPIDQIVNYVKELRKSQIQDKDGETIILSENVPIYAYIISTLTPKLIEIADDSGYLTPSPDKLGYFGYHRTHKIYFEIISYKKMIQDAKARNKILFDKLNLS